MVQRSYQDELIVYVRWSKREQNSFLIMLYDDLSDRLKSEDVKNVMERKYSN